MAIDITGPSMEDSQVDGDRHHWTIYGRQSAGLRNTDMEKFLQGTPLQEKLETYAFCI
jgi:hypothetical protein